MGVMNIPKIVDPPQWRWVRTGQPWVPTWRTPRQPPIVTQKRGPLRLGRPQSMKG
jgi:hypothetical protein